MQNTNLMFFTTSVPLLPNGPNSLESVSRLMSELFSRLDYKRLSSPEILEGLGRVTTPEPDPKGLIFSNEPPGVEPVSQELKTSTFSLESEKNMQELCPL